MCSIDRIPEHVYARVWLQISSTGVNHANSIHSEIFYFQQFCKYYIEDITRWREDINFMFEWRNNILRTSAASE